MKRHNSYTLMVILTGLILFGMLWSPSAVDLALAAEEPPEPPLVYTAVDPQPTGGPDHFGYRWEASTNQYAWLEASGGSKVELSNFDVGISEAVAIGFPFKFYEKTYETVYVGTDGVLYFADALSSTPDYPSYLIPHDTAPDNFIAVLSTDLVMNSSSFTGTIYAKSVGTSDGKAFVIQWNQVAQRGVDEPLIFQAVLYENGNIKLQYKHLTSSAVETALIGIEDSDGLDGLLFMQEASTGISSGHAVLFQRPGRTARAKLLSPYASTFAISRRAAFPIQIRNTGDLASVPADTYNLTAILAGQAGNAAWKAAFFTEDGVTPLRDTNGDGTVDTGPVPQGSTTTFVVVLKAPDDAKIGDWVQFNLQAASSTDSTQKATGELHSALPAPFAQAFVDVNMGIGLDLIGPAKRTTFKVEQWFSGSTLALSTLANGNYLYFWERNAVTKTTWWSYTDLEYSVIFPWGDKLRQRVQLTDNENNGQDTWQLTDEAPALALAPNGLSGVVWLRNIEDLGDPFEPKSKSNAYFAVVDPQGEQPVSETALTQNDNWTPSADLHILKSPSIASTPNNRFVIAVVEEKNQSLVATSNILVAVYGADGRQLKGMSAITTSTPGGPQYDVPTMAGLKDGRTLVVFTAREGDKTSIAYAVVDEDGKLIKSPAVIPGAYGWKPDALQLSTGQVALAWTDADDNGVSYAILDGMSLNVIQPPTVLENPNGHRSAYVSITRDDTGHAILTWMDIPWKNYLYYALIDGNGTVKTPPMAFYPGVSNQSIVTTSYAGQGNAAYNPNWRSFLPLSPKLAR